MSRVAPHLRLALVRGALLCAAFFSGSRVACAPHPVWSYRLMVIDHALHTEEKSHGKE